MSSPEDTRERMLGNVSRQGAIVLVTRGAAVVLGIASTVLLGRFLGPTGYGKFRLGSVVVTLIAGLCLIGLDRALMRYLPILEARGEQKSSRALLIKSGSIVLVLSSLLSAALLVWAPFVARVFFRSTDMVDVLRAFSFQLPVLALFRFLPLGRQKLAVVNFICPPANGTTFCTLPLPYERSPTIRARW